MPLIPWDKSSPKREESESVVCSFSRHDVQFRTACENVAVKGGSDLGNQKSLNFALPLPMNGTGPALRLPRREWDGERRGDDGVRF